MFENPFNPSFGKVPPVFIDREEELQKVIRGLHTAHSPYQTTMISGVRGVGKTAFLADICKKLEESDMWIIADLPADENIMESLVQTAREKASSDVRKAIDSIDGISISLFGISASYSTEKDSVNYQLILEKILKKLKEKGIHLLVAIDEVEANDEIRHFAKIYQIMIRNDLPISLLMTGLPKSISELQNSKALTFLLRSARVNLPFLNDISVKYGYRRVFEENGRQVEESALKRMTSLAKGYSYAFQLLGYLLWETEEKTITDLTIDSVMNEYKETLFRNAYYKIFEELSTVDQKFVLAMAESPNEEVAMKEISKTMNQQDSYISTYRRRLIDAGVIQASSYGHVSFPLPLFKEYLQEFHM